jgi:hypothetical protein
MPPAAYRPGPNPLELNRTDCTNLELRIGCNFFRGWQGFAAESRITRLSLRICKSEAAIAKHLDLADLKPQPVKLGEELDRFVGDVVKPLHCEVIHTQHSTSAATQRQQSWRPFGWHALGPKP